MALCKLVCNSIFTFGSSTKERYIDLQHVVTQIGLALLACCVDWKTIKSLVTNVRKLKLENKLYYQNPVIKCRMTL